MAKRAKRATARVGKSRATARIAKKKTVTVKVDSRRFSRLIEFTPRMIERMRQRYEDAGESPEVISRSVGVAKATIQRLVLEQGWKRLDEAPRDLSGAEQLAAETRALRAFTAQPLQDGGEGEPPVDIEAQIERLLRLLAKEIDVYENQRATLGNDPQAPRAANKTSHNLATLTSTLDDLRRMRAGQKEVLPYANDDDLPTDIDALRDALTRRIEAFMESRTDEECGLGPETGGDEGAVV